ncbi:hypothetical protein SNEBB_010920, partial [Seison nebaliae]
MVIFRYNINIKKTEGTDDVAVNAFRQIIHNRIIIELMKIHLKTIDELCGNNKENLSVKETIIEYRKEVRDLKISRSIILFPNSISIDNTSEFQYSYSFVQFVPPAIRSELNRLINELIVIDYVSDWYYSSMSNQIKNDIHLLLYDYIQKDLTLSNHSLKNGSFSISEFKKYVYGRSDIKISRHGYEECMKRFSRNIIDVRSNIDCEEDLKDLYNLISTFCDKPYTRLRTNGLTSDEKVLLVLKLKYLSSVNSCTIDDEMSHDEVYELMEERHPHANESMMKTIYRHFIDYFDHNGFNKRDGFSKRDGAQIFSSICNVNLTEIDFDRSVGGAIFLAILNVFRIRKGEINRNNVHFLYQETVNFIFEKKSL